MSGPMTVACAQLGPVIGDLEGNRRRASAAVEVASARGAALVVLPELCSSGYVFSDAEEARRLSEPPHGPTISGWRELTARKQMVLVGGFCERADDGTLYNSAAVVDRGALLHVYRKAHLWDREALVFTPGNEPAPVIDTSAGRVGVAICYDSFFPEVMRGLALGGAQVIALPVNEPAIEPYLEPLPSEFVLALAAAQINRVVVAQADRARVERGVAWVGASLIADVDGRLLTARLHGEGLLIATVDLERADDKRLHERNDALADRRPELYAELAALRPHARASRGPS